MNDTIIEILALEKIRPSKTNPRTHFDEKALAELTDSVRVHGILQPLVARPDWCMGKSAEEIATVNGNAPAATFFEIVAGERRYRAATTAKVSPVPVSVRLLSDQEALEEQLVENLQREDLDAFEEAAGYRKLLDLRDGAGKAVHNVDTIHDRTGKSRSRIYDRLKLLNAPKRMREAVRGGLSVVIAEKVGALPTKEMRDAATSEILKPTDPRYGVGPMTVRQALDFIEENFMRQLAGAVFDQADATLVPPLQDDQTGERQGGGSCVDCPKRTGNMPALKGTKRPDVCTNTHCFALKIDAHFARLKEAAVASGKKLLSSEEAGKLFEDDETLWFDSPYVLMSEHPDMQEVRSDFRGTMPTWAKLLGAVESKPETVFAPDPKGRLVELVDRSLAIEAVNLAAKQKGETSIFDKTSKKAGSTSASSSTASSAGTVTVSDEEKKKREEAKIVFQITLASFSALIAAIDAKGAVKGFWDELIRASITHAGHDGSWLMCKMHGLDSKAENGHTTIEGVQGAALEYGLTLPDEKLKLGYVVELLLSQRVKFANAAYSQGLKDVESFQAFVKLYKVDLAAIEKDVRAKAKEGKPNKSGIGKQKSEKPPTNAGEMRWTRKPVGEFKFNSHGVCETPATLVLPFPKTTRAKVYLLAAPYKGGWVADHIIESGVNAGGGGGYPSISGKVYPVLREALVQEALRVDFALVTMQAKPSVLKLFRYYAKQIDSLVIEGDGGGATTPAPVASHHWEKITGNKYRCTGCGAAAVKHDGKILEEKAVRGKPCSQSEVKPKAHPPSRKATARRAVRPKKNRGLTPRMRAKLSAAMKARWAARGKATSKKGGARK